MDKNLKNKRIKMEKYITKALISNFNMEQQQFLKRFFKNI